MTVIRRSSPVGNLTYAAGAVISYDDFKNRVSVRWAMAVQFNSYAHLRDVPSIVTLMIGYPPFL
jgi:hypothetical protein